MHNEAIPAPFFTIFASCWAADLAIIRPKSNAYAVTIRIVRGNPAITSPLSVNLVRTTNDADVIDTHWDVPVSDIASKQTGTSTELTFTVNVPKGLYKQTESYVISIPYIPASPSLPTRAEIPLSPGLEGEIVSDLSAGFCRGGLMIALTGGDVSKEGWDKIDAFFGLLEKNPNQIVHLKIGSAGTYRDMALRTLVRQTRELSGVVLGLTYSVCINTVHDLPKDTFNAILDIESGAPSPLPLLSPITGSDLSGRQTPSLKDAAAAPGDVGDRALERNLDVGLAYTQSRDVKTGTTSRLGVVDLRLAPLLDIKRRIGNDFLSRQTIPSWSWFLTPLYIDANVATGRIVDNTVALNRISLGPQFEFRYMKLKTAPADSVARTMQLPIPRFPNVHRFILSANHYSDRDLKQLEYVAKFEYQPLLGMWNRPRETRWKSVKDPVKKTDTVLESVGWKIIPKFGTEIGNTYQRRNPAEAITPSDFVRRGYFGMDVSLEVTEHFIFSASDTVYMRGEVAPSHLVNYIKLEADFPIGSPFRETAQSFFLTYERGSLPPFEALNTKVLRLGYRIRSENWFGFRR